MALADYARSSLYSEAERTALEYADCITLSNREVDALRIPSQKLWKRA